MIFLNFAILFLFINLINCLEPSDCKCKIQNINSRIVGGNRAGPEEYPWYASLNGGEDRYPSQVRKLFPLEIKINSHFCGASILNEEWILTAAHCAQDKKYISVGFGSQNDLAKIFDNGRIPVEKIVIHEKWNNSRIINDIALLKLSRPIKFDKQIAPVCLEKKASEYDYSDAEVTVCGFGSITKVWSEKTSGFSFEHTTPRFLQRASYNDVSDDLNQIDERCGPLLCLEQKTTGSSCFGDSGGPAHATKNSITTQIGLVSYGFGRKVTENLSISCDGGGSLNLRSGRFTRITNYIDWIESHIGKNHC